MRNCWLLAAAAAAGPPKRVGLPCGAVGMGPRAIRLKALILAQLVRRRLPDDLHGRVENLERALERAGASGERVGMGMMEMYSLWQHAYSPAGQRSLAWRGQQQQQRPPVLQVELCE